MTHDGQTRTQIERCCWSLLVQSLTVSTVVFATLQPAGVASATECLVNEILVTVQGTPSWDAIISPPQIQAARATGACLCEQPYYPGSRSDIFGKADNRGVTTLTTCFNRNTWRTTLRDRATLGHRGRVSSRVQLRTVSTVAYNSKNLLLKVPTTLPELKHAMNPAPSASLIGPVQKFQSSPPAGERSLTEPIPSVAPRDSHFTLFGDHSWGPFNQYQSLQRLPNGESHRMNVTTSSVFHGSRDCTSDCP